MPQMNKGGKFVFGKSIIKFDGTIQFPAQAINEYHITDDGKSIYLLEAKLLAGFV